MKITYSHIDVQVREAIEDEVAHQVEKLNRLLQQYENDSVQLHSSLEKTPRRAEFCLSLKLTLPNGVLHATGRASDVRTSAKAAFAEIEVQVKKHQHKMRKDHVWKRRRARGMFKPGEALLAD